jgi:transposase
MSRYDLTDFEWRVIEPLLPNKTRGVPRVDDRRVLNGIFWVLRSGAPWRDLPEHYGPRTTCYNRFVRWRKAGVWKRLMDAITAAHDGDIQMIDSTSVRAYQQAATAKRAVWVAPPTIRWSLLDGTERPGRRIVSLKNSRWRWRN